MSAAEVSEGFSISGLLDAGSQTASRFPVREIPLFDIQEHPGNVAYSMDEEGIARLAESIRRDGLTDLPLVRRLQGGGFQMISGHRRMAAFRLLSQQGPSYSKIPCRIASDVSDEQALVLLHTANFFTRSLTVTERAAATKALDQRAERLELANSEAIRALLRLPIADPDDLVAIDAGSRVVIDAKTMGRINRELIRWERHYNQAVRALNTIAMFVRNKGGIDPQVAKEQLTKAASELELVQGSVEEIKEMVHAVHESERFWR